MILGCPELLAVCRGSSVNFGAKKGHFLMVHVSPLEERCFERYFRYVTLTGFGQKGPKCHHLTSKTSSKRSSFDVQNVIRMASKMSLKMTSKMTSKTSPKCHHLTSRRGSEKLKCERRDENVHSERQIHRASQCKWVTEVMFWEGHFENYAAKGFRFIIVKKHQHLHDSERMISGKASLWWL